MAAKSHMATKQLKVLITEPSADYALLDSGLEEKLERFGKIILSRPDPQALWDKGLDAAEWKKADGVFTRDAVKGEWVLGKGLYAKIASGKNDGSRWAIDFSGLKFWIKPTPFKHVGIFPEQSPNWDWMREKIVAALPSAGESGLEVLNLFGYTGGASLACAQAGAKVVHVDSSKAALTWARENAELSGLGSKPIRWILDDARAFVKREVKRGRKYHGIIMDPPAFGHGAKDEVWKIENDLRELLDMCFSLLVDQTSVDKSEGGGPLLCGPLFFLINGYSAGYSALGYENLLLPLVAKFGGRIENGELVIKEGEERLLPCGIFARWMK